MSQGSWTIFPRDCYFPYFPMLCKLHSSHSPLICIFIVSCYFTRTWKYTGGLMSVLACISILQESALFSSLLLVPQSVTFARKLSLNQRNRDLHFLMCQSDYVLSYFIIIHLCILSCQQTESYFRDWIMSHSPCIYNGIGKYFAK